MRLTLLAGDIGGTKTILRLIDAEAASLAGNIPRLTTLHEHIYPSSHFPDLVPIVHQFCHAAAESLGSVPDVAAACFGIAGPVVNNTSELTNLSWSLAGDRLQRELGIPQVTLINDFAAVGYGVLGLAEEDLATLQAVAPDPVAPIAVIGAGTGLGEGFLIPNGNGVCRVFATEGGHVDFAPRSTLEIQLLTWLRERNNLERVSVERVVSGTGIASIYQFLRDASPDEESSPMAAIYRIWAGETGKAVKTVDLAAEVAKAALAGSDFLCEQAMQLFVGAYGAEAGNLALKILPYGGLYVAGGVAAKILPLLRAGGFMKAFLSKGRMRPVMEKIPVHVVLNPRVGLMGAALRAAQQAVPEAG